MRPTTVTKMVTFCDLFRLFTLVTISSINISDSYKIKSSADALDYLTHFGYLPDLEKNSNVDVYDTVEAVKEFQDFSNLVPNGKLNSRTVLKMNMPRCGNRDVKVEDGDEIGIEVEGKTRRKRETVGPRWNKRELTYRVAKFSSSRLKPKTLQKEIDLAFKYWEREANITFKKIWDGKPDIEISFVIGNHGDEESFDGPSKTLAHAFYPTRSEVHFDDQEKWTASPRNGHNLRTVAVHEIGHSLGLGHSKERKSVMYLMYQGFKEKLNLHSLDIQAIQSLYGPKDSHKENQVLKSAKFQKLANNNPSADLCLNSSIDAISTLADGFIYIFKGEYYYKMKMGHAMKHPRRINETFPGLPSNLDTVLTIPNGKSYFFKGQLYWRSTGTQMDKNYPKKISTNFLGVPNFLDASFIWSWNNMVYFFKKNRYWRYNFDTPNKPAVIMSTTKMPKIRHRHQKRKENQIIEGYPKKISSNWPGIPDDIEDGFKAPNGRTYIFKSGEYWQFHNPDSGLEASSYPRSSEEWWFGCSNFIPDPKKIKHARKRNKPFNYL